MKSFYLFAVCTAAAATLWAAEPNAELKEPKDRLSYALGLNFGNNLRSEEIEINMDTVVRGIQDGLRGGTNQALSNQEVGEVFQQLRNQLTARREEKKKQNKAEGEKFLAENATKEGVVKLPSGLQYKVVKQGTGDSPKAHDEVSVKYTGKLIDGTIFDSTDKNNGKPATFQVNRVIRGWTEALQKMKPGDVWELYIPSELAYGEPGNRSIPPNSTLLFTVELLEVHPKPEPKPAVSQSQPVTSDIIKVPSAEELKKGAQIEVIKPQDLDKEIEKEKARKEAEAKKKAESEQKKQ